MTILHMGLLRGLAQRFGAVRIEHHPDLPAQYQIAVLRDSNEDDSYPYDGFTGIGTGVSLEQAIEEAHRLQHVT